jgi:hypothetical protein
MQTIPISAKLAGGEPVTVDFDMPDDLDEMVAEFGGKEVVYNQARQNIVVAIQGRMRNMLKPDRKGGPADEEEIQKMVDAFEIGTRKPAKSKAERVKETYAQLDPELKKQLLAEMRAMQDQPAAKPAPKSNGQTAAKTAAKQPARTAPPQGTRPAAAPARPAGGPATAVKRPAAAPSRGPVRR